MAREILFTIPSSEASFCMLNFLVLASRHGPGEPSADASASSSNCGARNGAENRDCYCPYRCATESTGCCSGTGSTNDASCALPPVLPPAIVGGTIPWPVLRIEGRRYANN